MKRDLTLLKLILERIQSSDQKLICNQDLRFDGYSGSEVDYHVNLLIDQEFVDGKGQRVKPGGYAWNIRGLTWSGHDYLTTLSHAWIFMILHILYKLLPTIDFVTNG